MNLIRRNRELWDPVDFVLDLQDEMSRCLSTTTRRGDGSFSWQGTFEPDIELREEAGHFLVRADLPGIRKDELEISVTGNLLTLKGERKRESDVRGKDYFYSERMYGGFARTLTLPTEVDTDKVKATYKDGVLELTLPKAESAKPKQIKVEIK